MADDIPQHVKDVDILLDEYIWTALDKDVYDPAVRAGLETIDDDLESTALMTSLTFCF